MLTWDENVGGLLKRLVKEAKPDDRLGISQKLAITVRCPSCGKGLTWQELHEYRCGKDKNFTH
jgi:hypothetical protein